MRTLDELTKLSQEFGCKQSMAPYHFHVGERNATVIHSMNNPGMFETIPKMRENDKRKKVDSYN